MPHSQSHSQQECSPESAHRWASKCEQDEAMFLNSFPLLRNQHQCFFKPKGEIREEFGFSGMENRKWNPPRQCEDVEKSRNRSRNQKQSGKINLTILYARRARTIGSSSWANNRSIHKTHFSLIFLYPQKLQHVFTYHTSSRPPNDTDKHVRDEVCKLYKLFLRAGRILGLGKKSQA